MRTKKKTGINPVFFLILKIITLTAAASAAAPAF